MSDNDRDRSCLARIQAGDMRALEELYDRHTPLLYSVALRIVGGLSEAEDVVQETWLQVWKQVERYDPGRGAVAAWLLTVVRTRALDRARSAASRKRVAAAVEADPAPASASPEPPAEAARRQLHERVTRALDTLGEQQRRVLELAYFEGLSQSEIAERLSAPLGTVKSWTRQGLARLREQLPQEEWA